MADTPEPTAEPEQQLRLIDATLTPMAYAIGTGQAEGIGPIIVQRLIMPNAEFNVVFSTEMAKDLARNMMATIRESRGAPGLITAQPSDVDKIAQRRKATEAMKDGQRRA